jgi:LDH2 family malate/lactate/ureidoglycolate dehydrogenase
VIRVVGAGDATRYSVAVLEAAGYSAADAALCADAFVESALRGIDSHGFVSLLPRYARVALKGNVSSAVDPTVDGHAAVAVVEGRRVPGLRAARFALDEAIDRARIYGVGAAVLRNSSYLGALWWCVFPAAEAGMIGLGLVNGGPMVAPHGGLEPLHGTNPIAFVVPREPFPLVLDMRTNALRMADYWRSLTTGEPLPSGGVLTPDGRPTDAAADVEGGIYLPLAGAKGFGLALVVDILGAALAGGTIGREVSLGDPTDLSAFFLALDPAAFGPGEAFSAAVERLVGQVHETAPTDPSEPVRIPGERMAAERERRLRDGIPVDLALVSEMEAELRGLGLEPPALVQEPLTG